MYKLEIIQSLEDMMKFMKDPINKLVLKNWSINK